MIGPNRAELDSRSERLCQAYDPATFVDQAKITIEHLQDYLQRTYERERAVWPNVAPDELLQQWPEPEKKPLGEFSTLISKIIADSTSQNSPGFIGQQLPPPPLLSGPVAMVSAILNNSSAIFQGAPVAIALEQRVIRWMIEKVGWSQHAGGVLTSGGTLGALTALLAMRQAKMDHDCWGEGVGAGNRYAIFVSEESHYCNQRACAIMGLGQRSAVPIATDDGFRMRLDSLQSQFDRCVNEEIKPLAVVGNACSTATGSHDDLNLLADFCEKHDLWLHVDAAHGGSSFLSPRLRPLLSGIARADSMVWDAHKMMLMPSFCTAILVRDAKHLDSAFRQEASYLLGDAEAPWHQPAARNFETTKPAMVLPLYVALRTLGIEFFAGVVEYLSDLAQSFTDELEQRDEFAVLVRPESNIVCFRRIGLPETDLDLDVIQVQLRERLNAAGRFFIMKTKLRGKVWLRVALMNPATRISDLCEMLDDLVAIDLN